MLGLILSIALLISSVISAKNGGNDILVAAQLIASGIFYVGYWCCYIGLKLKDIEHSNTVAKSFAAFLKELGGELEHNGNQ